MIPPIAYQIFAITSCMLLIFTVGYYLGYRKTVVRYAAQTANDREEMLSIEKALKRFWDDEKGKLEQEKAELQRRISFLEGKLDQYRQKAAGIGMMGLRRSKLADMFIGLLIENENLEEKVKEQEIQRLKGILNIIYY